MDNQTQNGLLFIKKSYLSFSEIERRIADYILEYPQKVINMTTRVMSSELGVSEGSIINFSNHVGFSGFTKLKINIAQNMPDVNKFLFDSIAKEDNPKMALRKMVDNAVSAFNTTYDIISSNELIKVADMIMNAKRIEIYGVGSSSMVVNDVYYRFLRIGLPVYAVTDPHISSVSASMLDEDCVAIAISHTGKTIETLRPMQIAKSRGAKTIGITSYANSPLAQLCDALIVIASKEAEENKEAVVSRLTQLMVMDSICLYISSQCQDKAIEFMENTIDIIGEHRK